MPVWTHLHTHPLLVSPAWGVFCECKILNSTGRTEEDEGREKAGGVGAGDGEADETTQEEGKLWVTWGWEKEG